jgi:hypothetical protein
MTSWVSCGKTIESGMGVPSGYATPVVNNITVKKIVEETCDNKKPAKQTEK